MVTEQEETVEKKLAENWRPLRLACPAMCERARIRREVVNLVIDGGIDWRGCPREEGGVEKVIRYCEWNKDQEVGLICDRRT